MSDIAITCEHLSKRYRIGERESYKALRDVITDGVASPFRRLRSALAHNGASPNGSSSSLITHDSSLGSTGSALRPLHSAPPAQHSALSTQHSALGSGPEIRNPKSEIRNSFWALDDVSFEVKRGEVVGIIGRNGAGKSTLLKILSRITKPTKGHAKIHGRVGSLLEVGTGFHPELTGRENIYLNAAILGMRKAEVAKKFDEIVAFAEVEQFIDTPVKRYSSGMYVRLAFAVAAHMETEVLLVDEVLAVGDAQFQKKCLGKMEEMSSGFGRTVLFVSHNLSAIRALCRSSVVLHAGRLEFYGRTDPALLRYSDSVDKPARGPEQFSSPNKPSILSVSVNEAEAYSGHLELEVRFASPRVLDPILVGAVISNQVGAPVFGFNTWQDASVANRKAKSGLATLRIPNLGLHSGVYTVAVFLGERAQNYDVRENATVFTFVAPEPLPAGISVESIGAMRVAGHWQITATE